MPWYVHYLLYLATILAICYFVSRVASLFARRTVESWSGRGVATDLEPAEAAVLLSVHPGTIVAALAVWLELAGKVRIVEDSPPRMTWTGGAPADAVEAAFVRALGENGQPTPEGAAALLEAIWERTNETVGPYSGRQTAIHYRHFVKRLWRKRLTASVHERGLEAWLLLRDPGRDWERLGDDEDSQRVRRALRISGLLSTWLFRRGDLSDLAEKADSGFFRYRNDLVLDRYPAEIGEWEKRFRGLHLFESRPSDSGSVPPPRDSDT